MMANVSIGSIDDLRFLPWTVERTHGLTKQEKPAAGLDPKFVGEV